MMARFLLKIIYFSVPLILFLGIVEISVRKNTFHAKSKYLEEHRDSIEILFLGSSHNWRAINPEFINYKTAPLAHGGSAINIDFLLLDKYIDVLPKLKVVIFELGYHNLEDYRDKDWSKNHIFNIYYDINNYDGQVPLNQNFLILSNFIEYFKRFLSPAKLEKFGQYNEYGFIYQSPSYMFESLDYDSILIHRKSDIYLEGRHTEESIENFKLNTKVLKKEIERCLSKNIKVVLLSPPKHYTYNDKMIASKLDRRDQFLDQYIDKQDVNIWNYEKTYQYQTKMFDNPDHLTPDGAASYTKKLDSLIQELLL